MDALLAGLIFAAVYALIATERLDKTLAALLGGTVVVLLGIVSQESAFEAIDLNVIFLLAGMMILAGILRRTGFFQWLAIRSVRIAGGEPYRLLIVLSVVSAFISACLDNVTTVVLLAPVTLYIAGVLRVSPVPFLISEILASNIGGTATLIGDPPNILIGSAAGLGFVEFLLNLGPVAVLILIAFLFATRFLFKGDLEVQGDVRAGVLALDAREVLTDIPLLRWSLGVIALTILGFVFAVPLGLETGTIALFGATLLTVISRVDVATVLEEIEWPTLFFFIGLFMLVSAIVEVGIIDALAEFLIDLTGGDATVTSIGLLWLSAIASAIVDNIPYTTTMIPVVERLGASGIPIEPLWWALALGACLGGNATIVGASANVVGANLAGRSGHPIGFATFFRYGFLVALLSIVIATAYLSVRYLW
jgi:Na+/H+ antiporter NhaD/arsenite permease-like protein